jgi:glycosyltransferase involved in cell wall biosynthesis
MTMADALSQTAGELTLLTAGSLFAREPETAIFDHYGIEPGFHLVRIPVAKRPLPFMEMRTIPSDSPARRQWRGWRNRFVYAACLYAYGRRPDLVYSACCRSARHASMLGLPTVVEFHGSGRDAARQLKTAPGRSNLLAIVTVSEYLRGDFIKHGLPGEKILVEPNGVDLTRFTRAAETGAARAQLELPNDRPLVVYCGHFYEKKGVHHLIEAARQLPDMRFCLVGGWPEDIRRLEQQAQGLDNVIFRGFVSHDVVPTYLAAADILVLPNSANEVHAFETCPLKLFEYAAAARPIVATRIPGIESLVSHGEQAWLTAPDAPDALTEAIRQVRDDRALAARLVAAATNWVGAFDIRERARRILGSIGMEPDQPARS